MTRYALALLLLALLWSTCGPGPSSTGQTATWPDTVRPDSGARGLHAPESTPAPIETTARTVKPEPARAETAPRPEPVRPELPPAVERTFPGAWSLEHRSEPFPVDVVRDRSEAVLGYSVLSDSAGTTIRGYAGPVPVQVLLDAGGRPRRIYILDNAETPAYLEITVNSGLLDRLLRFDPAQPDSVDAVTLATSSSKAIIAAVTRTSERVAREIVDR